MTDNISDEALERVIELTYNNFKSKKEEERLHYEHIEEVRQKYLKPLYPHTESHDGEIRNYECCEAFGESPGRFWCGSSTSADSSFVKLGLAICLYMKFLKHSSWVYLILALFAITSCVVCVAVAYENGFDPLSSYTTFFYATSYGAFSGQYNKCQYTLIDTTTYQAAFSLSCPYGKVNGSVSTTTVPAVISSESLNSLFNCRNERKQLESNTNLVEPYLAITSQTAVTYSNNNSQASITLQLDPTKYSTNQAQNLVAFVYQCYDNTYNIGEVKGSSDNFFYYVVVVDLFISFIFIIYFCSEVSAEDDEIKQFRINQVGLHDFSAKVEGFHRNTLEGQLLELFKQLEQKNGEDIKKEIVALSTPLVQEEIEQRQERRQIYQNIYDLINKYYFRQSEVMLTFNQCHKLVQKDLTREQYNHFCNQIRLEVQKLLALGRRHVTKYNQDQIQVYLVFNGVQARDRLFDSQERVCCQEKIITSKGEYKLIQPPVPDMINWENRYKWTKLRSFFSWSLMILIILGAYLFFGWIQYRQSILSTTYNYKIDCAVLFPSTSFTVFDATLSTDSNYVTCYCKDQSIFNVVASQSNYCDTWQRQYITFTIIPLLISLGIVVFNAIVGQIFKFLSFFECQKHAENEQMSYAFKRGFLLTMNMGLIIILLNINYNNSTTLQQVSFIFLGRYTDFTSDWYENIGSIIILTMAFNITFAFIELLFACGISCLKSCWDTRCCCMETSRETKDQYVKMHSREVFPIGQRYAYLMATFFISMVFSGVIPALIPITLISFLLIYITDKFLLFKYYQTPIQYTQKLHKAFLYVLYVALMAHFALTAFFLGEPSLIATGAYFGTKYSSVSSGNKRIDNMIRTAYIIPYVVIFLLLALYAIFRKFIGGTLASCAEKCRGREGNYTMKSQMVQQMKLFKILSLKQRETLMTALEIGLRNIELKKKEKIKSQRDMPEKINLKGSQRPINDMLAQEEQILMNSLHKLKKIGQSNPRERQGQKLLGLPSYEESVQSNSLRQDEQTIIYERRLRSLVFSGVVAESRLQVQHSANQIPTTDKLMLENQDSKDEINK